MINVANYDHVKWILVNFKPQILNANPKLTLGFNFKSWLLAEVVHGAYY